MPKYEVGKDWFFPTIGDKAYPGDVIELTEEEAERFMANEPGLLKPVRHTTQGHSPARRGRRKKE